MTDAEKAELKARIIRERGYWARFHDVLLERTPEFLTAYIDFQSAPINAKLLPQKLCEFIYIAIDISVNHMYDRGARRHMEYALKAGAKPEEVLQVILLATALSAQHPIDLGLEVLAEEGGSEPGRLEQTLADAKQDYVERTGHWPAAGDSMLALSPECARAYMGYGTAAYEAGPLSAKERELIGLALCAAPTALHRDGVRRHIRGALKAGASHVEILATLHLSAALSVHTCTLGVPGFEDVLNGKFVE